MFPFSSLADNRIILYFCHDIKIKYHKIDIYTKDNTTSIHEKIYLHSHNVAVNDNSTGTGECHREICREPKL